MPELSAAEKFLADWTSAYMAADRPDRLAADTSGESCLADAELAGILKEDVVKAADGDLHRLLRQRFAGEAHPSIAVGLTPLRMPAERRGQKPADGISPGL